MERVDLKSRQRVIDHGEVFTPPQIVDQMLELVARECERVDSRFLEPACGTGNFLAEILARKLRLVQRSCSNLRRRWERDSIVALGSVYGIDLLGDNVLDCQARLVLTLQSASKSCLGEPLSEEMHRAARFIASRNVIHGDALALRAADGSPIVFSEWSPVSSTMIKRRDFKFDHLLGHAEVRSSPLFSDLGQDVFLPSPAGDYPPCHYLEVCSRGRVE